MAVLQPLGDQEPFGRESSIAAFDWQKYLVLEKKQQSGEHLSVSEKWAWAILMVQYLRNLLLPCFEAPPVAEGSEQTVLPKHISVPGIKQAGCGASTDAKSGAAAGARDRDSTGTNGRARTTRGNANIPQALIGVMNDFSDFLDELHIDDVLADAAYRRVANSVSTNRLDFSRLELSPEIFEEILHGLPIEVRNKITILNLSHCKLANTFSLPAFIELKEIILYDNLLSEFPESWYVFLSQNSDSELDLTQNPIVSGPISLLENGPRVIIDNHPNIVQRFAGEQVKFADGYPSPIWERLYLGGQRHCCPDNLKRLGVTAVINCAREVREVAGRLAPSIAVTHLDLMDDAQQPISLRIVADELNALIKGGAAVMVNCAQGVSRSSTVVIAWLMVHQNMSLIHAIEHVWLTRPFIRPNAGFMRQLVDLALTLKLKVEEGELIASLTQLGLSVAIPADAVQAAQDESAPFDRLGITTIGDGSSSDGDMPTRDCQTRRLPNGPSGDLDD